MTSPPTDAGHLALRVQMTPQDLNVMDRIFGGVILSHIDHAGFSEARRHGLHRWVTVAMDAIEFKQPVFSGDILSLYTTTARTGRTSVSIGVRVFAERFESGEIIEVTSATTTMVAVDEDGRAIPFESPPTMSRGRGRLA